MDTTKNDGLLEKMCCMSFASNMASFWSIYVTFSGGGKCTFGIFFWGKHVTIGKIPPES